MKKVMLLFALFFVTISLFSENISNTNNKSCDYKVVKIKKNMKLDNKGNVLELDISYPQFYSTDKKYSFDQMNKAIEKQVIAGMEFEEGKADINTAIEDLKKSAKESIDEYSESVTFSFSSAYHIYLISNDFISILIQADNAVGGMQNRSHLNPVNYSLSDNSERTLNAIVSSSEMATMSNALEKELISQIKNDIAGQEDPDIENSVNEALSEGYWKEGINTKFNKTKNGYLFNIDLGLPTYIDGLGYYEIEYPITHVAPNTFYIKLFGIDYSDICTRDYQENDLNILDKESLKILRNAVFAKYGYIFKSEDLQNHFGWFDWYNPTKKDVTSMLNDIEKKNIALIKSVEKKK